MKFVESIDRNSLERCRLIAESSEFAIFDDGEVLEERNRRRLPRR